MSSMFSLYAQSAIAEARRHAHLATMRSSADLCIDDAEKCFDRGLYKHAVKRAADSLRYSVGVFSPVYQQFADD